MIGEDLGLKPSTVEKSKSEYFPLGKTFNKALNKEDKKAGLLKKLKYIEEKIEQLLNIKNKTKNIKDVTDFVEEPFSLEEKALIEEIRTIQKDVGKLIIRGGHKVTYNFRNYETFKELFRDLCYKKMTINDAKMKQNEFNSIIGNLNNYSPKTEKYIEAKKSLLNNVRNFYKGREKIIEDFKEGIFLLKSDDEQQQTSKKAIKTDVNAFNKLINKKETDINKELFKKHFNFQRPSSMLKDLYQINDREKNNKLVSVINSGLKDFKKEIEEMSKEEREVEKPDKIVDIVEKILKFNKQIQQRKGLKILTPNQMLSRLPISLAQIKTGNNSGNLKNEIRQLLYSLYRSKNMTKQVYNNLIKYI